MALKWKRTVLEKPEGRVVVMHWEKHHPIKLLKALEGEAVKAGGAPAVALYRFGPRTI